MFFYFYKSLSVFLSTFPVVFPVLIFLIVLIVQVRMLMLIINAINTRNISIINFLFVFAIFIVLNHRDVLLRLEKYEWCSKLLCDSQTLPCGMLSLI